MSTNLITDNVSVNTRTNKDTITFLKCRSPLALTKVWQNGHIKDYDTAKYFRVVVKPVKSLKHLATILDEAAAHPQFAAIRGTPNKDLEIGPESASKITRTLTNFSDTPKHWVMFDIDSFTPTVSPTVNPAECVRQWVIETLPLPFHDLAAYWQLSSSAGHKSRDPNSLRAHVWFWLDKPVSGRQWKRWAEHNNLSIDKSVLSPVQLHYTANPVIEKGVDPFIQRSGLLSGANALCTALCKFNETTNADPKLLDNGDQVLKDPRQAYGLVGEFNTKVSIIEALTSIIPDQFTFIENSDGQWDGRRLNFLHGSGGEGGAYIHSDQLHLINMQNHAPYNSQGKALNAFDLVRVYKFGRLDPIDPFLQLDVTTLPSHKAMAELAQVYTQSSLVSVDTEVVTEPTAQPTTHQEAIGQSEMPSVSVRKARALKTFPEPFPGVMQDLVSAVLLSAHVPQPELTLLGVLIGMAGACGGHYYLPSGMRLNLYGLGIAKTGTGKDIVRHAAGRILSAGGGCHIGNPASGQGLQDAIPDGSGSLVLVDEAGHLLSSMNDKNAPAHMIMLTSTLLELFSAGRDPAYHCRVKARTAVNTVQRVIAHPSVSFFGVTTVEKLATSVSEDNVSDGLMGRLLIAKGREGVEKRWQVQPFKVPASVETVGLKLAWAPSADRPISHFPGIEKAMQTWTDRYQKDENVQFFGAYGTRAIEKLERIAGVLAVWDCPENPVITKAMLHWAKEFIDASNDVLLDFLHNDMGGVSEEMRDAIKLLYRVKKMADEGEGDDGWVKQSAVTYTMNWSKKRTLPAIETLIANRQLVQRVVKTKTTPSVQLKFLRH